MNLLSFLGASGVIIKFYSIFDEIPLSKQNSPRLDAAFCGVTSGAILFAYVPLKGHQTCIVYIIRIIHTINKILSLEIKGKSDHAKS